jgi:hypothetical protein
VTLILLVVIDPVEIDPVETAGNVPVAAPPVAAMVKIGADPVILIPDPAVNPVTAKDPFIEIELVVINPVDTEPVETAGNVPTPPLVAMVKFGAEPDILIPDPAVNPVTGNEPFIKIELVVINPVDTEPVETAGNVPVATPPLVAIVKFGAEPVILIPDPAVNPVSGSSPFIKIELVVINPVDTDPVETA